MFNNLTKEIFIYSLIPALIIALISLLLIFISKKKGENIYKYNYIIKVFIIIIVGLVFPLITGYSIWVYERMSNLNTVSSNILYLILLAFLIISLLVLLIVTCVKLFQSLKSDELEIKEE